MFYPIDQKIRRPDIRVFEKALATAFGGKGVTTHNAEQAAMKAVIDRFVALGYKPADLPGLLHVISQESQGLLAWGQWVNDGKRLIDVSAKLTEALHLSDCGELIISDVLPGAGHDHRGAFYVRFSGVHGIRFSDGDVSFEGAYVILGDGSIRIVLCGAMPTTTLAHERWKERYDLRIPVSLYSLPVREAVEKALDIDLQDITDNKAGMSENAHRFAADQLAYRMSQNHASWCEAVFLIVNLLAWLKHAPEDVEMGWPENAPARLVEQFQHGAPRAQERARSKLWSVGFSPVERVGLRFKSELEIERTVSQHIRRGHWRNQAHGEGFSLRKMIWILPTIVGKEKGEGE